MSETNYHTQALTRGLVLLELLSSGPQPLTLLAMHERTQLPKSTLVRLLAALTETNFVVRVDERPAYRLGYKVMALAEGYVSSLDLSAVAGAYLSDLSKVTQQTSNLGVLDGADVVHVCVRTPDRPLRFETALGTRDSAHSSGLGKMLLAGLTELDGHLPDEPFPARTDKTITSCDELVKELKRTAKRGYALDDNEHSAGLRSVAVPVVVGGRTVAALSVSGPAGEFGPAGQREYLMRLQETADLLSADPDIAAVLS